MSTTADTTPLNLDIHDHSPHSFLMMYFLSDFVEFYSESLEAAPVITKAMTSATVYFIGDIIAQKSEGADLLDRPRIIRSTLAGFIGHGPLSHIWYNLSEDLFNVYLGWTAWWVVFPKVILDQTTWGPFWNNVYIVLLGLMKGQPWRVIWQDIRRTTIPLIVSGLKLWPLAHIITYGYVSVDYRLLWVDICEILWVTILATQAAGKNKVRRKVVKAVPVTGVDEEEACGALINTTGSADGDRKIIRTYSSPQVDANDAILMEMPDIKVQ